VSIKQQQDDKSTGQDVAATKEDMSEQGPTRVLDESTKIVDQNDKSAVEAETPDEKVESKQTRAVQRVRGAIVVLTHGTKERIELLDRAIRSADLAFNMRYKYPVVVFTGVRCVHVSHCIIISSIL